MPESSKRLRVFLASPGDVSDERDRAADVIDEINRLYGEERGFHLDLIRWETHSRPQLGRPQGVLNQQLRPEKADIFVGIMWKRFGQPTDKAESGTEEEFRRAYEVHEAGDGPEIMFFFCDRPVPPSTDIDQLQKVQSFREKFQQVGLYQAYESIDDFKDRFREALIRTVRSLLSTGDENKDSVSGPAKSSQSGGRSPKNESGGQESHAWMANFDDTNHSSGSSSFSFDSIPIPNRTGEPSDLEKREALSDGFGIIREYFRQGKKKLEAEYSDLRLVMDDIDSRTFEAELFVSGQRKNHCRLWVGGSMGASTIAFAEGSTARNGGGMNDCVRLKSQDGELFFEASGMGFGSMQSPGTRLNPESAAKYFWERFLRPMMH